MRSRVKQLVADRELKTGQRITQKDIEVSTQLGHNAVSKWMSPRPLKRIDDKVVVALMDYFGLERLDDLLFIDRENAN